MIVTVCTILVHLKWLHLLLLLPYSLAHFSSLYPVPSLAAFIPCLMTLSFLHGFTYCACFMSMAKVNAKQALLLSHHAIRGCENKINEQENKQTGRQTYMKLAK